MTATTPAGLHVLAQSEFSSHVFLGIFAGLGPGGYLS